MTKFFSNANLINRFSKSLELLNAKQGDLLFISGDKGFGKSRNLYELEKISNDKRILSVTVKLSPPTNNILLSNLQPYYLFNQILNELNSNKKVPQNQRLAFNVGLTVLSSLPLAGDLFYLVKELRRDLKEHFREKKFDKNENFESFWDVFATYSQKNLLVIYIDDLQYADVQSIELLSYFSKKISTIPILIVATYNPIITNRYNIALKNFLSKFQEFNKGDNIFNLKPFDANQINQLISESFQLQSAPENAINWFLQKTYGVPLAVFEYVNYLKEQKISIQQLTTSNIEHLVPTSLNSLFISYIEKLDSEEKNILSICAAEGKEFSVTVVSRLLSYDVLTTVRKLKNISEKTGIIISMGAKKRYGEVSTCFMFNQAIYQTYFEDLLEYEEKTAIHTQIKSILKSNYDKSDDPELKRELLPYIIAHSNNAEDAESIKELLQEQFAVAKDNNDYNYIESISNFLELNKQGEINTSFVESSDVQNSTTNANMESNGSGFNADLSAEIQRTIAINPEEIVPVAKPNNFDEILEILLAKSNPNLSDYIKQFSEITTSEVEKTKSLILLAKLLTDQDALQDAKDIIQSLSYQVNNTNPTEIDIIYLNTLAIIQSNENKYDLAMQTLKDATTLSLKTNDNFQLLTLSNIAIILKKVDIEMAMQYRTKVINIANELGYLDFVSDFTARFEN